MDLEDAIRTRRTHKQYGAAPLDQKTLESILELARWAPNHHLTQPFRFRVLGPETRARLESACGEKEALKLRRAPTLVLATAVLTGDPQTDEEDILATGCAVYAILLVATARGLASYWRTPAALGEPGARAALGLGENERIVGLVHLGPAVSEPPAKERPPLADIAWTLP
jgi:nitroreductase